MYGLIELFVVLGFAMGWVVIEYVASRYDQPESSRSEPDSGEPKNHSRLLK
jgi:hypothetical protein